MASKLGIVLIALFAVLFHITPSHAAENYCIFRESKKSANIHELEVNLEGLGWNCPEILGAIKASCAMDPTMELSKSQILSFRMLGCFLRLDMKEEPRSQNPSFPCIIQGIKCVATDMEDIPGECVRFPLLFLLSLFSMVL